MIRRLIALGAALAAIAALALWVLGLGGGPSYPDVELDHSRPRPQGGFYRSALEEPPTANPFTFDSAVAHQFVLRYTHDPLMDRRSGQL